MKIEEGKFNRLSLTDRADLVWRHGQFVDSVMRRNYCMMLYTLKDQFVELYLDLRSKDIVWISLANEFDLEKYLSDVQIEV